MLPSSSPPKSSKMGDYLQGLMEYLLTSQQLKFNQVYAAGLSTPPCI